MEHAPVSDDDLAELDALLESEQSTRVAERLAPLFGEDQGHDHPRLALRYAKAIATTGAIDRALLVLRPALREKGGMPDDEALDAHALAVDLYAVKRCRDLALRQLGIARAQRGDHWRLTLAEANLELALDERERAAELLLRAQAEGGGEGVSYALARLAYVRGTFATAAEHLDAVPAEGSAFVDALRVRAAVAAAQNDFAAEAKCWKDVVDRVPASDRRAQDWLNVGFALVASGRRTDARDEFTALWRAFPDHSTGRYAQTRADALTRATEASVRTSLAFPSIAQKHNFCGPAVLELCLRFLGIQLTQDEIAADVKRESGTPMAEIVRFLEERDIDVRRVVVTPERIKTAINLGLPIILQEEYSTTSHVAVITGYDEALQILIMHDPMTHRISTRPLDWSARAGQLYGSGGVLVIGRKTSDLTAIREKLDADGLKDAAHLRLLDDCARRRKTAQGGAFESANPEEQLAAADKALALDPTFRLAWLYRFYAKRALYLGNRTDYLRDRALEDLYGARTTFPDDEWPCQLHGRWLVDQNRHAEAFAAYLDAHLRDEGDGNNLTRMGESKRQMGMLADAEKYLLRALENWPDPGFAEWVLSAAYVRAIEVLDAEAKNDPARVPPIHIEVPKTVTQRMTHARSVLEARAVHFNEIARELDPGNPFQLEVGGMIALHRSDDRAAEDDFRRAAAIDAGRWFAPTGLAAALERLGRPAEALPLLLALAERWPRDPDAWSALAAFHARQGDRDAEAAALTSGIERSDKERARFVEPLFDVLEKCTSAEQAAARVRELAEANAADGDLLWKAASHLEAKDQRGHAIGLLRKVVEGQPRNVSAMGKLGRLLRANILTRDEGVAVLERAVALSPKWSFTRRPLALHYLATDPAKGLAVLAPVLHEDTAWTWEVQSMLLRAAARIEEADVAERRAIAAYSGSTARAIEALCDWHRDDHRYDRAIFWADKLFEHPVDKARLEWVQMSFLASYRLAGQASTILPKIREMCANGIDDRIGHEVYFSTCDVDHELAARAAATKSTTATAPKFALRWRIREARQRAHLGDDSFIAGVREEAKDSADAWSAITTMYEDLERYPDANDAADRANALDPTDVDTMANLVDAHLRRGRTSDALACALRLFELHPYDHQGPERLAGIHAKSMRVEDALAQSAHAVDAAPYCNEAHRVRALALLVAGDKQRARAHAERSLAIANVTEADAPSDVVMILRALEKDVDGLMRCFARRDPIDPPEQFPEYRKLLIEIASA